MARRRSPEHEMIAEQLEAFGVSRKKIASLFVGKTFQSAHQGQNPQHQGVLTLEGRSKQGRLTVTIVKKEFVQINPGTGEREKTFRLEFQRRHPRDRWKTQ